MRIILAIALLYVQTFAGYCADKPRALGWKASPHGLKITPFAFHPDARKAPAVPDAASLESQCSPVRDQGNEGACTAFAGTAALDFAFKATTGKFPDFSPRGMYYDSRVHDGSWPNDAGSYTGSVVWVAMNKGVGQDKTWRYIPGGYYAAPPSCYVKQQVTRKAVQFYEVDNTNKSDLYVAIAITKRPVMFGGYVTSDVFTPEPGGFELPYKGKPVGGHERLIVGYDKNLSHTYKTGRTITGFFRVRNSWGSAWGDKGHSWIPIQDIENPKINEDFAVFVK